MSRLFSLLYYNIDNIYISSYINYSITRAYFSYSSVWLSAQLFVYNQLCRTFKRLKTNIYEQKWIHKNKVHTYCNYPDLKKKYFITYLSWKSSRGVKLFLTVLVLFYILQFRLRTYIIQMHPVLFPPFKLLLCRYCVVLFWDLINSVCNMLYFISFKGTQHLFSPDNIL